MEYFGVNATMNWLTTTGAPFQPEGGIQGVAHLKNYTVEYAEWGDGPPIVLVPGLAGGYQLLGPLARELARNHRVICYQLRGEDNCFAIRQNFGLSDLVHDLGEFLDWMCLESPTLFGVSFGGIIALEFAARHRHRLDRLVLTGVGSRFQPNLVQKVAGTVLSRFPLPTDSPFVNQFFNLLFGAPQKQDDLFHFVTRQCWQTDQSMMAYRFQMVEKFNMTSRLSQISAPTLILSGEKDILVSQRSLMDLGSGIPRAKMVRLPGCGHLGFVTQAPLYAERLEQFLAQK